MPKPLRPADHFGVGSGMNGQVKKNLGALRRKTVQLFPDDEVQPDARDFDKVAVVELGRSWDRVAVYRRNFGAGANVVAVVALIDLRGHFRLKPALQFDG